MRSRAGGRLGRAHTRKLVSSVEKSCGKFRIFHFCVSSNVRGSRSKSSECQSVYVKEKVMRKIHELTFYSPSLSFIPCRNHLCDVHTLCDRWLAWFPCSISQRCCSVLCEHESCRFAKTQRNERGRGMKKKLFHGEKLSYFPSALPPPPLMPRSHVV